MPRQRAAQRAAVDEPPQCCLRRRPAWVAPTAGAAGLLALGGLDAGEPHGGAGNTQEVAAQRLGTPLQRLSAADQGQLAGEAGEIGLGTTCEPGNAAGGDNNGCGDPGDAGRNAECG